MMVVRSPILSAIVVLAVELSGCGRAGPNSPARPQGWAYPIIVNESQARARTLPLNPPALADASIAWSANPTMRSLRFVADTMKRSAYSHDSEVDPQRGEYNFDCSGMVDWVLQHAAPVAAAATRSNRESRPRAEDFHKAIVNAPTQGEYAGWVRIATVSSAQPGDVIAWLRDDEQRSGHTGHVAFLLHTPVRIPGYANAYRLRIADATSSRHAYDTRELLLRDGFGFGTIVVVVDQWDAPVGYGWSGTRSRRVRMTEIAIGRALR